MNISASLENYLEVIATLSSEDGYALSNDIADKMNVKRSSVTVALRNLSECDLITYKKYKPITLTPKGKKLSEEIMHKHKSVKKFLQEILGVNEEKADNIACEMEHFIGSDVTDRLISFSEYVLTCPRTGPKWVKGFERFYKHGKNAATCKACINEI